MGPETSPHNNERMKSFRTWMIALSALALTVYILGAIKVDVMDIDSSHYAEMSREMHDTGKYLEIRNRTVDDYLDKPPLIFWLTSLFYSMFGVSTFVFRLPAILASLIGAYSVFRFTRLHYDRDTGLFAALILLSSQAYFLYNHNILTDTFLANFTIFSIWQLSAFIEKKRWYYFLGAFSGLALAMMSKGPLGLMVPVAGFSVHFIYKKQWRNFFRWEWLAGTVLILILLSPMMVGLYRQFGLIGLQFFFWTQSFGRITGQSHWHDQSSPFYFIHTFLWFMLPWTVFAVYGLVRYAYALIHGKQKARIPEAISIGGFLLSFAALSMSRYKLPQYILVLLPLTATFTAASILPLLKRTVAFPGKIWLRASGYFIAGFYWLAASSILILVFPQNTFVSWIVLLVGTGFVFFIIVSKKYPMVKLVALLALAGILTNLILNIHFYPRLLYYQPGKRIAHHWKNEVDGKDLFYYQYHSPSLDFHLGQAPPVIHQRKLDRIAGSEGSVWIITDGQGRNSIPPFRVTEEIVFESYPVQALTLKFLNAKTREETLRRHYLMKLSSGGGE